MSVSKRRRLSRAGVVCTLVVSALSAAALPASATNVGDTDGCTPGFWKNHTEAWEEEPGVPIRPQRLLRSVYGATKGTAYGESTMLQALSFKGGSGVDGAQRILLRAATAAYLNAAHEGLAYPYRRATVNGLLARVNGAISSGDRALMLALATELDAANNLGCPL